jgi:hypothetical protein
VFRGLSHIYAQVIDDRRDDGGVGLDDRAALKGGLTNARAARLAKNAAAVRGG